MHWHAGSWLATVTGADSVATGADCDTRRAGPSTGGAAGGRGLGGAGAEKGAIKPARNCAARDCAVTGTGGGATDRPGPGALARAT